MKILIAVAGMLIALIAAESAAACSCASEPGEKETLRGFDAAATARLIEIKNEDPQSGRVDLVYRVLRVYKNQNLEEGERLVIRRSGDGTSCGLPRTVDKRYGLRLGRDNRGKWTASSCALLSPRQLRLAAERTGNSRQLPSSRCAAPDSRS